MGAAVTHHKHVVEKFDRAEKDKQNVSNCEWVALVHSLLDEEYPDVAAGHDQ